ncbi:MAG: fasciclin domain-containing protein [Schleiferiaceae bacterium]
MKNFALRGAKLMMIAALALGFTACDDDDDIVDNGMPATQKTIAEIAIADGNFTILVDALTRTGLDEVVADADQDLTVFAPTDAAFMDLLTELNMSSLDEVEMALGTDGLKNVVLYHVLGKEVTSSMVATGYVTTQAMNSSMDNLSFYMNTSNGVMINDRATVTTVDIDASNGVIHVIDKVILPVTLYDLLSYNDNYSSLVAALGVADGGLDALLSDNSEGPFTLFAPDNDAFGDLLMDLQLADLNALVGALGTDGVADVLTYHVVTGNVNSDEVPTGNVPTVNGANIMISVDNGVSITDMNGGMSMVTEVDIQGTNGVVHAIDAVLLP